ncbi:MAG: glycosyltransferase [Acidimicrobiales bacterium]
MTSGQHGERRIRCLWLTKGLGLGGVERLLVDMLPLVDHDRFQVDVAYVLPWKDNLRAPLEELGATVICLGRGGARSPRWVWELQSLLRRGRYDIVHSHAPVPGSAARVLAGSRGPALIHTEHNVWDRYRPPTRIVNALTFNRNAAVITVSDKVASSIRPGPGRPPVETIHHGTVLGSVRTCSADERRRRRAANGLPLDAPVLAKVANFTPKKDHATLLRALSDLTRHPPVHLALIGSGPLEADLRRQVDELGIGDRVAFLGTRDDVFELLPLMDGFVLSSQYEGFPISLIEAMATGLPCVATTVGGIPEIIVDGTNGLLVPPGRPDQLRDALARIVDDPELRADLGAEARRCAEGLDLRHAVERTQTLYESALARRRAGWPAQRQSATGDAEQRAR